MILLRLQISVLVIMLLCFSSAAQQRSKSRNRSATVSPDSVSYPMLSKGVDKDSLFLHEILSIPASFRSRSECIAYVNKLPAEIQAKGYINVSLDSIDFDSANARIVIYIGDKFQWASLDAHSIRPEILEAVGWRDRALSGKTMDFREIKEWQEKILLYMENNGHPFAKVYMDSLDISGQNVTAHLKLDEGPAYHIDSIRIIGDVKITNDFLQRYLDIPNGSSFSKEKLLRINKKIRELTWVEEEFPSRLIWLGQGSILELYLKQKKSSQINVIVGFLPNNDQLSSKKLLVTGEANLNLKNALGGGETIGLNWQQLQVKSPRLSIQFQYPYLFHSPVGMDFSFNMLRKDSTFLNVNFQLGAQYVLNTNQSGKLFLQKFQTILNGVNKSQLISTRRLPDEGDVSTTNVGVDYEFNNTNYRLNPTRGNELHLITSVGTKKIKKNNEILDTKDPGDPTFDFASLYDTVKTKTYQFMVRGTAANIFLWERRTAVPSGQQLTEDFYKVAKYSGMNCFRLVVISY